MNKEAIHQAIANYNENSLPGALARTALRIEDEKEVLKQALKSNTARMVSECKGLRLSNKLISAGASQDREHNSQLTRDRDTLRQANAELVILTQAANCPQCGDKSGAYYDNQGAVHQCQWCAEVNQALAKHQAGDLTCV